MLSRQIRQNRQPISGFVGQKCVPCDVCGGQSHYIDGSGTVSCVTCSPPDDPDSPRLVCWRRVWRDPANLAAGAVDAATGSRSSRRPAGASREAVDATLCAFAAADRHHDESSRSQTPTVTARDPDLQRLVDWYRANRDRIPASPFQLDSGVIVTDRAAFLRSIDADVSHVGGVRDHGALRVDLRRLMGLIREMRE